jgi:hypothetical protein
MSRGSNVSTPRGCPRCGGNLGQEYDVLDASWDVTCLQCGFRRPVAPRERLPLSPPARPDRR